MLSIANHPLAHPLSETTLNEISNMASSSLNSLEYLTAVTFGLAQENCTAAVIESGSMFTFKSPLEVTLYLSMSPVNLLADISKRCVKLQDAAQNYFEYVSSDWHLLH